MKKITVAICTYNRAERLTPLIESLRRQESPIPFEILIVDNNSIDNTQEVLAQLARQLGAPLRFVVERQQGIPYARNRAIGECLASDFMLFMDDDELPASKTMISAAVRTLDEEGAECVGGKVSINFGPLHRPHWLHDELLPFYAEMNYGEKPFWVTDHSTPLWTSIIAYKMSLFRDNPELRFDVRYNRAGKGIGGGEDAILLRELLQRRVKIRYQPEMAVEHFIEPWRITRRYFLKLHFTAGKKYGRYEMDEYSRSFLGVPPFMVRQAANHLIKTGLMYLERNPRALRQGMNAAHAFGSLWGRFLYWRDQRK